MYWPFGAPRFGVVCLHGSEGGWAGWNDLYCALFEGHGFAALSRNYTKVMNWPTPPDIDDDDLWPRACVDGYGRFARVQSSEVREQPPEAVNLFVDPVCTERVPVARSVQRDYRLA